jgi:hypothetical protein
MLGSDYTKFSPNPAKTYRISGQLDFQRHSVWTAALNIRLTGSRLASGADLGVQAGGGHQHITALFMEGEHSGPEINVRVDTVNQDPWLAIIGNDFYAIQDGRRPNYATGFKFDVVSVVASKYTTGYSGDGNAAIRFQANDVVNIRDLTIKNFQIAYRHIDVTHAAVGSNTVVLENFRSGVQVTRSRSCSVGDVYAYGSTSDKTMAPGANALVIRAVIDFSCGDVVAYNTGEHGIRVVSRDPEPGVGIMPQLILTKASFGAVSIYQPGGCGFKAASGDNNLPEIGAVQIGSLYVEDAGMDDYDTGGTFQGNNHFGLNLQNVNSFTCSSYITRRNRALHNGKHAILVRGCENFHIGNMQGGGTHSDLIFWNATSISYNITIGSGVGYDFGRGGTGGLYNILNRSRMGRVFLGMDAQSGPQLMRFSGETSNAPVAFWKINCSYQNIDDPEVQNLTTTRTEINVRNISTVSETNENNYPIGAILFCNGQAGSGVTARNSLVDVYTHGPTARGFVTVPVGVTPNTETGVKLRGTWRQRGHESGGAFVLVQKVGF